MIQRLLISFFIGGRDIRRLCILQQRNKKEQNRSLLYKSFLQEKTVNKLLLHIFILVKSSLRITFLFSLELFLLNYKDRFA